jgi:hypothetical protein
VSSAIRLTGSYPTRTQPRQSRIGKFKQLNGPGKATRLFNACVAPGDLSFVREKDIAQIGYLQCATQNLHLGRFSDFLDCFEHEKPGQRRNHSTKRECSSGSIRSARRFPRYTCANGLPQQSALCSLAGQPRRACRSRYRRHVSALALKPAIIFRLGVGEERKAGSARNYQRVSRNPPPPDPLAFCLRYFA